tara:strand:- start:4965 stop:5513 length:549 start_codon:yes stop_codon:yes gene_type:complete
MAERNIDRNVRGQIVSYPIVKEGDTFGSIFFLEKEEGVQTKPARYLFSDVENNLDTEIKELSFPRREISPRQIARTRAYWGSNFPNTAYFPSGTFQTINGSINLNIPWPPYAVNQDGSITPLNYGRPGDVYPPLGAGGQPTSGNSTDSGQGSAGAVLGTPTSNQNNSSPAGGQQGRGGFDSD